MRLSETHQAGAWLRQFDDADMPVAARLLDDLTVVTPTQFSTRMRALVERALGTDRRAVALYPVWEVAGKTARSGEVLEPWESIFPLGAISPDLLTGDVPDLDASAGIRGSRRRQQKRRRSTVPDPRKGIGGSVGGAIQLIGEVQKAFVGRRLLDRPALHVLRAEKCRTIILVDDVIGSGERVERYLAAFYRHRTIKSWFSYPGLDFVVVCYAASDVALRRLRAYRRPKGHTRPHPVRVEFDQHLYRGRSFWSEAEARSMTALCEKYAPRTSRPTLPLGFGKTFSMIVFPHGAPNTAPAILWAENPGRWRALFPNRAVPSSLLREFDQVQRDPAGASLPETLVRMGQLRLAGGDWARYATPTYRRLVLLLGVLSRGFRHPDRIAEITEMTRTECLRLVAVARRFELVRPDGGLSPRGVLELDYARTVGALPWEPSPLREEQRYFPSALRGDRGPSSARRSY